MVLRFIASLLLILTFVQINICYGQSNSLLEELRGIHNLGKSNASKGLEEINQFFGKISPSDSLVYIKACRIKANYLAFDHPDSSVYFYQEAIDKAIQFKFEEEEITATSQLADHFKDIGKHKKAGEIYDNLFHHKYYLQVPQEKILLYLDYASFYLSQQNLEKSLNYLEESVEYADSLKFNDYDIHIYNKFAYFYGTLKDWEKVIEYNRKVSNLMEKNNKNQYSVLNTIGVAYSSLGNLDSAMFYFEKVIRGTPPKSTKMYCYQYLANICNMKLELNKGLIYSDSCIYLAKQSGVEKEVCACEYQKAAILNKLQNFKESQKLFNKNEDCINKHHKLAFGSTMEYYQLNNELNLKGNKQVVAIVDKIIANRDSLRVGKQKSQILELETKYQTTQKEAENELLKKDQEIKAAQISRQKNFLLAALLGLGGLGFGFYMLLKRNRERQLHIDELASKNKKIETLNRETIHRTKNYLNLASNLLAESNIVSDDERISKLIEDNKKRLKVLSMVNNRLSTSDQDFHVNINEYITELVEDLSFTFKKIKRIPLDINYEIDSLTLDSDKSLYLGLIINELITNSIKHAKTDNDQPLQIKIQLSNVDGLIKLHYSDNGESIISMPNDKNLGLGLIQNLCDQIGGKLNHVFKNGYHFSLSFR